MKCITKTVITSVTFKRVHLKESFVVIWCHSLLIACSIGEKKTTNFRFGIYFPEERESIKKSARRFLLRIKAFPENSINKRQTKTKDKAWLLDVNFQEKLLKFLCFQGVADFASILEKKVSFHRSKIFV